MMKIAENTDEPGPVDQFKEKYYPQSAKRFEVSDKVPNINHWKFSDKVGDPEMKNGWKPNLKWSDKEAFFKCQGQDRAFRTFEKIIDTSKQNEVRDAIREKELEELLIKQAPRSLQMELKQQIENEKKREMSLKIGNRITKSH